MNEAGKNVNSVLGLDVGTSRIVVASKPGEDYRFDSQLNAFVSVPYLRMTENSLARESVPYAVTANEIMVLGNESPRFADLLSMETRRPMTRGMLNGNEPESLAVITQLVKTMTAGVAEPGRICFSVPAPPLHGEENLTYHEATLRQTLESMGFEVRSINEGLAVVYSELEDSNYTGVGVSFGGGLCNVTLAYLSMPALSFSIAKAGDFIDSSTASVTGLLATRIRLAKEESFHFNGLHTDKLNQVLAVYYDDVIQAVVNGMKEILTNARRVPKMSRPIPLVIAGGTSMPKGFRERFEKTLRAAAIPLEISEVRMAADPLTATARGALIAALTEM